MDNLADKLVNLATPRFQRGLVEMSKPCLVIRGESRNGEAPIDWHKVGKVGDIISLGSDPTEYRIIEVNSAGIRFERCNDYTQS